MTRKNHKRGFNLIEAAIVLGVVGLVIGGIWVGASAVKANIRVTNATAAILQSVNKTRELFSLNTYPDSSTEFSTRINRVIEATGGFPSNYKPDRYFTKSPDGFIYHIFQGCMINEWHTPCPSIVLVIYGNGNFNIPSFPTGNWSTFSPSDCTNLVRRVVGAAKNSSLKYVQISTKSKSNCIMMTPPFESSFGECSISSGINDLVCPKDEFQSVAFYFDP